MNKCIGEMSESELIDFIIELQEENSRLERNLDKRIDAWQELKDFLEEKWQESQDIWYVKIINKMREIENGSSSRNI